MEVELERIIHELSSKYDETFIMFLNSKKEIFIEK